MELGSVLGVLGTIFGIVLVVATVVAYFRASLAKATIDTLRDSNNALTERVGILEREQEAMKIKLDSTERENGILRDALGGKADIAQIVQLLEHHHNAMTEARIHSDKKLDDISHMLGGKRGEDLT